MITSLVSSVCALGSVIVFARTALSLRGTAGNVNAQPYRMGELVGAILISLFMGFGGVTRVLGRIGGVEPAPVTMDHLQGMATTSIIQVVVLLGLLALRDVNLVEAFGLNRLPWTRAFILSVLFLIPAAMISAFPIRVGKQWFHLGADHPLQGGTTDYIRSVTHGGENSQIVILAVLLVVSALSSSLLNFGFLYGVFKRYLSPIPAALICAAFSLFNTNIASGISGFLMALCLIITYEYKGSLVVPILIEVFSVLLALAFAGHQPATA